MLNICYDEIVQGDLRYTLPKFHFNFSVASLPEL